MPQHVIHLYAEAPPKPTPGAACNGCGVCCAYSLCPVGLLLHRRRRGPCPSLRWDAGARRYRCAPASGTGLVGRLARRWISAGSGCDCSLECAPAPVDGAR
ncbi:hypothetical protein [Azoarcus sp. KH32C]|uniref:hypothetical protein n=1 Tax=Azoarcus sp. KH32C TaxID=748247 RepID=UPI0002386F85|nr:hypothetical protein [Azoarcus sp. KH32C]BAL22847.1 hypothetical protein AZKH_0501 [Azoarcus sp. KH32C]